MAVRVVVVFKFFVSFLVLLTLPHFASANQPIEAIVENELIGFSGFVYSHLMTVFFIVVALCGTVFFWLISKLIIKKRLDARVKTNARRTHIVEEFFIACKDAAIAFLPALTLVVTVFLIAHVFCTYTASLIIMSAVRTCAVLLFSCLLVHRIFAPNHASERLIRLDDKIAKITSTTINVFLAIVATGHLSHDVISRTCSWFLETFSIIYAVSVCVYIILVAYSCSQRSIGDWLNRKISIDKLSKQKTLLSTLYYVNKYWGHMLALVTLIGGASWCFNRSVSAIYFVINLSLTLFLLFYLQYLLTSLILKKDEIIRKSARGILGTKFSSYSKQLEFAFMALFWSAAVLLASKLFGIDLISLAVNYHTCKTVSLIIANVIVAVAIYLVYMGLELILDYKVHIKRGRKSDLHSKTIMPLFKNTMRIVVFVLGALVILSNFGVNIAPLIAGFGVFGLAASFATQDIIKSFIQGLVILAEDNFLVGDLIRINDFEGFVENLTIRTVHLRERTGKLNIIPYNTIVTYCNLSRDFKFNIFNLQLSMDANIDKVASILDECSKCISKDPGHNLKIIEPARILGVKSIEGRDIILQWAIKTSPDPFGYIGLSMNKMLRAKLIEEGISLPADGHFLYFDKNNPLCLHMVDKDTGSGSKKK
ncbi:MAG: mechanosensitive ion channel family protein [Holosporales bacterium]|nr:mechanosensitive ion channel family protein [Holosporales bacterium]